MRDLKIIWNISYYRLLKLFTNARFWIILLFGAFLAKDNVSGILEMISTTGVKVTPWILPFVFSTYSLVILYGFLIVLLFCDAPFTEENEMYIIIRSKKSLWLFGQTLYVAVVSIIFTLFILISSVIFLIPNIEFSSNWGNIITTFAYGNDMFAYETPITISSKIIALFTPIQAMFYVCSIFFLLCIAIGSLMFMINLYSNRFIGIIISATLVLFVLLAINGSGFTFVYFSPFSWLSINNVDFKSNNLLPNLSYIYFVLIFSPIICWVLSFLKFKKMDFKALESI